jgi:hypothetical protein
MSEGGLNTGIEAVSRIARSGKEIHGKVVEGPYLPAKLRHPEKFVP